jgi:hypothetical protein
MNPPNIKPTDPMIQTIGQMSEERGASLVSAQISN